jgi:hypothetical protein
VRLRRTIWTRHICKFSLALTAQAFRNAARSASLSPRPHAGTNFYVPYRSANLTGAAAGSYALGNPQDTYWGQFEEVSKYNVSLNYLERLWLAWYIYMQNDVLATGIMSFVMHEVVYFGRSLPWIIIDCIPYFRRYKIQHVSVARSGDGVVDERANVCGCSRRSRPRRSNGSVLHWFCCHTLRSSCRRFGMPTSLIPPHT